MIRTATFAGAMLLTTAALAQTEPIGQTVPVNGMDMYYEVSGEGDPLIVLHGAYVNIETMGEIVPRLAETHKVYAIEFQGHGRTNDIDRPITYPNLAGDVAAFMDAVGIEKADIFGYSMGAALACGSPSTIPRRSISSSPPPSHMTPKGGSRPSPTSSRRWHPKCSSARPWRTSGRNWLQIPTASAPWSRK